jgi:uncharacterized delta-60 repeat protein
MVGKVSSKGGSLFGSRREGIGLALTVALAGMAFASPPADAMPGELDRSFGHNGRVVGLDWLNDGWASKLPKVVVARDGGIFAAAVGASEYVPNDGPQLPLLLRHYRANGEIDSSFGPGGTLHLYRPGGLDLTFRFSDLAVDDQGRPILFGTAYDVLAKTEFTPDPTLRSVAPSYAAIIRLLPDGRLDPGFGDGNGVALLDFAAALPPVEGRPHVHASSGAVDPQGRIVLIASQTEDGVGEGHSHLVENDRLLARLTPTGGLDPGFGEGDGVTPLTRLSPVTDMAFGRGGQITLGRPAKAGVTLLLRLDASGQPVSGFGVDGFRAYRSELNLADLEVDRFGRVLLLGPGRATGKANPRRLMRLRPGGAVDRAFGENGRVKVRVPAGSSLSGITSDPKGRILLGCTIALPGPATDRQDPPRAMGAVRLRPSGKPDLEFGRDGRVTTRFGSGTSSEATQLAFDGRNRLLVAGFALWPDRPWPERTQVLVRYRLR